MHMKDAVINRAIPDSERDKKQELKVYGFPSIALSHRESTVMKEEPEFAFITWRSVIWGKE